jgi:hypothetical protein
MNVNVVPEKEMFDFLATNSIYPMISKKGKIFLYAQRRCN